jgi:hypothetical protein
VDALVELAAKPAQVKQSPTKDRAKRRTGGCVAKVAGMAAIFPGLVALDRLCFSNAAFGATESASAQDGIGSDEPRDFSNREEVVNFLKEKHDFPTTSGDGDWICVSKELWATAFGKMSKKSCGPDETEAWLWQHLPCLAHDAMRGAYEVALNEGTAPLCIRTGTQVTLCKPGKFPATCVKNRRPICLSNHIAKVCERVAVSVVEARVDTRNAKQLAYQADCAAADAVAVVCEKARCANARGNGFVTIKVDLTGAFDRVIVEQAVHEIASRTNDVQALRALRWLRAFCADRQIRARIGDAHSQWRTCDLGVPQGTVCGPMLFRLLTHSLIREVEGLEDTDILMYSDDLVISREIERAGDVGGWAREVKAKIAAWCERHNMKADAAKSHVQFLGRRSAALAAEAGDLPWEVVKESRYLGVVLDSGLTFEPHVKNLINRCNRRMVAVRRLVRAWIQPRAFHIKIFYRALVESLISYAAAAYMPGLSGKLIDKINSVVHAANALILGVSSYSSKIALAAETSLDCAGVTC